MTDGATPIADDEADALLAPLAGHDALVVAVSGGADSMALLAIVAGWARRRGDAPGPRLLAVTIDHGLRPEAAAEAALVAQRSAALGIAHCTLAWPGPRPAAGVQAAARAARYDLLHQAASGLVAAGAARVAILTAHTLDDQAETVLMRLARGSGVDGLAGIPQLGAVVRTGAGGRMTSFPVLRPLLAVPRARILATLHDAGQAFIDDPSNRDRRFERVRVREALVVLEGIGIGAAALARTAARLDRARLALEAAADALEADAVRQVLGLVLEIDGARLAAAPRETAVRLLRRLLARTGGTAQRAELASVEAATDRLLDGAPQTLTLGGCIAQTAPGGGTIRLCREPGRGDGLERRLLAPGTTALWDRRFRADVAATWPRTVELAALGAEAPALIAANAALARLALPLPALEGMPVFREDGRVVATPLLAAAGLAAPGPDGLRLAPEQPTDEP